LSDYQCIKMRLLKFENLYRVQETTLWNYAEIINLAEIAFNVPRMALRLYADVPPIALIKPL
jgi:hypothetical protein